MNKSFPIFTVGAIVIVVLIYFFYDSEEPAQENVIKDEISSPITS